jgi:hypothetical protein
LPCTEVIFTPAPTWNIEKELKSMTIKERIADYTDRIMGIDISIAKLEKQKDKFQDQKAELVLQQGRK